MKNETALLAWRREDRKKNVSISSLALRLIAAKLPHNTPGATESLCLPFLFVSGGKSLAARFQLAQQQNIQTFPFCFLSRRFNENVYGVSCDVNLITSDLFLLRKLFEFRRSSSAFGELFCSRRFQVLRSYGRKKTFCNFNELPMALKKQCRL